MEREGETNVIQATNEVGISIEQAINEGEMNVEQAINGSPQVMRQISEKFLLKYEHYVQSLEKENREMRVELEECKKKVGNLLDESAKDKLEREQMLECLADIKKSKGVISCGYIKCKINSTDYKYEVKKCKICGQKYCEIKPSSLLGNTLDKQISHYKMHIEECEKNDVLEREIEKKRRRSKRLLEKEYSEEYGEEQSDGSSNCSEEIFDNSDMDEEIIDLANSEDGDDDDDEENEENEGSAFDSIVEEEEQENFKNGYSQFRF